MANSYFEFKQFRIDQGSCGMKVSTDACIQGAWTPLPGAHARLVDVGTGTGLLSLMLAQRAPGAQIDALEIDAAAVQQATGNFSTSPFSDRLNCLQVDVRSWSPSGKYDLLVCNPPFFRNSLTGPNAARNTARHNLTLGQKELLAVFDRAVTINGFASVLWPVEEGLAFRELAGKGGWFVHHALLVKDRAAAPVKRVVHLYSRQNPAQQLEESLIIKNEDESYTESFRQLMAPFYLHL